MMCARKTCPEKRWIEKLHHLSLPRRSNTNGTGPVSLPKYPDISMSPQYWPRSLTTSCVLTLCVVRKRSGTWSTIQSCVFLAPEWAVHVLRWSPKGSNWNFLQPQVVNDFSSITGIWAPMETEKKVCQRLSDQVSSLRWDLICHSQLMVLKKRIRLGSSTSWDSRPVISVRSTESSTVTTIRCREVSLNCSARCEPVNMSLRSWKDTWSWKFVCFKCESEKN
jgi:hypothetical protein